MVNDDSDRSDSERLEFLVCQQAACKKAHAFNKVALAERKILPRKSLLLQAVILMEMN